MHGPKKTSPDSTAEQGSPRVPSPEAHRERRRSPRKKANYFGVLTKVVEGEPHRNWLVKVEDISVHGVCLRPMTSAQGFLNVGDRAIFSVLLGQLPQDHLVIRHIHGHGLGSEFLHAGVGGGPSPDLSATFHSK
jgi:hypothetical protein